MIILGLTGSIGMGKSETSRMFRRLCVPVYDADAAVHRLQAKGGQAVPLIEAAFPGSVVDGAVDRGKLAPKVLGKPDALKHLEGILHPMVRQAERDFLRIQVRRKVPLVVLDVPLLFETKGQARCDAVAVVSAPAWLQRQRVLRRKGMTPEKLNAILTRQMPDCEKRRRADYIIPSNNGRHEALGKVKQIIADLRGKRAKVWRQRQDLWMD